MMATKVEHVMSYHHQQQLRNKFDLFANIKLHRRAQVSKYATILEEETFSGHTLHIQIKGFFMCTHEEPFNLKIYHWNNLQLNLYPEKLMLLLHVCTHWNKRSETCNYSDMQPNRKYFHIWYCLCMSLPLCLGVQQTGQMKWLLLQVVGVVALISLIATIQGMRVASKNSTLLFFQFMF